MCEYKNICSLVTAGVSDKCRGILCEVDLPDEIHASDLESYISLNVNYCGSEK